MKRKCVFFDRDGIVNRSPGAGYVERWEDFYLEPAFIDAAKVVLEHGDAVAIVTNQRGVARGIMSLAALERIHANLTAQLEDQGISLLGIYCCTHERDTCDCRKPQPGLLLQAAREHGLDLNSSWMIGDRETDIEAGRRAGCHTLLVSNVIPSTSADIHIATMPELPTQLRTILRTGPSKDSR